MMRMKLPLRRKEHGHRMRNGLMAAGAFGAAMGGLRRWRHRHHEQQQT